MSPPPGILDAYDPERFRTDGHALIDALADQLARWHRREDRVVPWRDPEDARAAWAAAPPGTGVVDDLARIARASTGIANPRCMGHQVAPPLPEAALAELVAAILNNGMAVYEMGPTSTPMELAVVGWMARQLGMGSGAGVLTAGGSLGNLTALLAASQAGAGFDAWTAGDNGGPPLAVLCTAQAHYSVSRAIRMMGWGDGGAAIVEVDERYRMRADAIPAAIASSGSNAPVPVEPALAITAITRRPAASARAIAAGIASGRIR